VAGPLLVHPLQAHPYARIRSVPSLLWLLAMVIIEVTRSSFNVGRIILSIKTEGINSQFIHIPLDMRSPHGLAVLAGIINTTPGTVWVEILPGTSTLLLHVFDLHDEQWWIDTIKTRYEKPLMDLFESDAKKPGGRQ
jgi:multicomponent K+:H+ antiporter subunit E